MTHDRRKFGRAAEDAAERFFRQQGYVVMDRNVRMANGEIDLIARHGDTIVFVEVKARRTEEFGGAVYAIDRRKEKRLIRLASQYLAQHGLSQRPCRFDVILCQGDSKTSDQIQHIEHAFEVSGDDLRW